MDGGDSLDRKSTASSPRPVLTDDDLRAARRRLRRAALDRLGPAELADELTYWRRQRARWLTDLDAGDVDDGNELALTSGIQLAEFKIGELSRQAERELRAMRHPDYPAPRPGEDLTARFAAAKYADLVDLVQTLTGQEAKKAGRRYTMHCPFHRDNTPSLTIYEAPRGWHCFSCQRGGDAVSFVAELEGLTAVEALRRVEELANTYPECWGQAS